MNHDAAFLDAIRESPTELAARLIYADWLEENGDSRADLIRIEEHMRRLPVFSDQYWQLKPRRQELRAGAPPDWLALLGYGTDVQPTFRHGLPDDCKGRWRLIREFTERWYKLPMPDVGGRAAEIQETEARLGRTLPTSVREWVAFAYDVRRNEDDERVFRDVYQMQELDGHPAVSLLRLCEGDYHWAVRHADLVLPDPAVHGYHLDYEGQNETRFVPDDRNPVAPSVSNFTLQYAFGYCRGKGGGFGTDVAEPAKLIRDLKAAFSVHRQFGSIEIFEDDNIMVRLGPSLFSEETHLAVEIAKPLPREVVPATLWEYTRNGGSFHGMFADEKNRQRRNQPTSGGLG